MKIALITVFRLTIAIIVSTGAAVTPARSDDTSFVPNFDFDSIAIDAKRSVYSPTGELIFPSVFAAHEYFDEPLAAYYMYYAPHDPPGGISLAYSNSLEGPWTEYEANPVISKTWQPHYDASHVSSPHALWHSIESRMFLYFHGDNDKSRFATSTDGIRFEYGHEVVQAEDLDGSSESSYLRVFEYPTPHTDHRFIGLIMSNNYGTRHIYVGDSRDGRRWFNWRRLISPLPGQRNVSSGFYWSWKDRHYVIYHASDDKMHIAEVDVAFNQSQYVGVFYDDGVDPASAFLLQQGNQLYLWHDIGPRLDTSIALSKALLPKISECSSTNCDSSQ